MNAHSALTTLWSSGPDGEPGPILRQCIEAATLAPSIHNSQPWRFRPTAAGVDVFADRSRMLPVVDPVGRELHVSLGAAIFNLRAAILAHGRVPLRRLFPEPDDPDLVARLTLGPFSQASDTANALARAIPRRHTNRRPFSEAKIPPYQLAELQVAAETEGASLVIADEASREALFNIVRLAEARLRREPGYWAELAGWSGAIGTRSDGVPEPAFGPWSVAEAVPLRDFGLMRSVHGRHTEQFEPHPTIVVLRTDADGPREWIRAGEAMERVLLTATVRGLSTTPMTQPLEFEELRALLGGPAGGPSAQVILRVGYGPPCLPSPRRPVEEVLLR